MTAPTSQVTLGGVAINALATNTLRIDYQPTGHNFLQMGDGTTEHQSFWEKKQITISASGWAPSGLWGLSLSTSHTLIVPDPREAGGSKSYTVWIIQPIRESDDINNASVSWSLTLREA